MTPNIKKSLLVSALLLELGASAHAATIQVDNDCTFQDALTSANNDTAIGDCVAGSGDDEIVLPENATIQLTETAVIDSRITIQGNDSIFERDHNYGLFRLFEVNDHLTFNHFTARNGHDSNNKGAGFYVKGSGFINLSDCVISSNGGGAIFIKSFGGVINNCHITENWIDGLTHYSAGVTITSGTVGISNSTIAYNNTYSNTTGGGGVFINNEDGSASLFLGNSTVFDNHTGYGAGGISIQRTQQSSNVITFLVASTVSQNRAYDSNQVGGILNNGGLTYMSQSLVAGNINSNVNEMLSTGGGIYADDSNLVGFNNNPGIQGFSLGASDFTPAASTIEEVVSTQLMDNGGATLTLSLPAGSPAIDAVTGSCARNDDQTDKARPIDGDNDGDALCDVGAFESPNLDIIFINGFEQ